MASVPAYLLPGIPTVQPPNLEGDSTLATEILPGPPFLISAQQTAHRRDLRKPTAAVSYLPASDPGSTYSGLMVGTTSTQDTDGSRRKRARVQKGQVFTYFKGSNYAYWHVQSFLRLPNLMLYVHVTLTIISSSQTTGRAQRASARNLNGMTHVLDHPRFSDAEVADPDPFTIPPDSDEPSISRSNSALNLPEGTSANTNGRTRARKDKGKGKEIETTLIRVKEEPNTISLHSPEPSLSLINEDHCSACRSQGALVYCDGCPRAFHFWCLDPPMEAVDLPEGDSRWFCPSCSIRKNPPPKPPPSFIAPLIYHVQTNIPAEYQLPDDIRTFFKDVGTGPRGTYVDGAEIKQPRLNRHGQLEDRDQYRLKDRNGIPVLCFRCGTSALPAGLTSASSSAKRARSSSSKDTLETWKSMVSCDHCSLHWHLDCLDPPLPSLPSLGKKWMCPNHVDQLLHPKRRLPKQNAPLLEITKPNQFNNGNIEITHPQTASVSQSRVAVDEIFINGRRYRVPERVVVLDFWSKIQNKGARELDIASGMSSPLTSLSSLEDADEEIPVCARPLPLDAEDIKVAELLCSFQKSLNRGARRPNASRTMADSSIQTDPVVLPHDQNVAIKKRSSTTAKRGSLKMVVDLSGQPNTVDLIAPQPAPTSSTAKRKKSSVNIQTEPTRELRSRSKNNDIRNSINLSEEHRRQSAIPNGSTSQAPPIPNPKPSAVLVKLESRETLRVGPLNIPNPPEAASLASRSPPKPLSRPGKPSKNSRLSLRLAEEQYWADLREETATNHRGQKRKERDDADLPDKEVKGQQEGVEGFDKGKRKKEKTGRKAQEKKQKKKAVHQNHTLPSIDPSPSAPPTQMSAPPAPSLKIRLPRLSNVNQLSSLTALRTPSIGVDNPRRP